MEKFKLPESRRFPEKREFKLTEKSILAPWPTAICKLNMMSMVWNISMGQLGLAVWLHSLPAPAYLLIR